MRKLALAVLILALLAWPDLPRVKAQAVVHGSFINFTAPLVDTTHGPASSYNIYRSTVTGGPYTLLVNVTTTSYVDPASGLAPGTTYFYVVKAVNSIGQEGPTSAEVSGTLPNVPGAVLALQDVIK
jgi:fibronectin type 3 domain-containing protein